VKLSLARFWCHYDGQWVFTHDSHIHRDPRLALCGDHKRTEEATCVFFILFFYDYVMHLLCVIYISHLSGITKSFTFLAVWIRVRTQQRSRLSRLHLKGGEELSSCADQSELESTP